MQQVSEHTGIVEIMSGYGDIALIDRDRLIEMLQKIPAGDIRLSTVPHDAGRAVIAKPSDSVSDFWYVLAPMRERTRVPRGK